MRSSMVEKIGSLSNPTDDRKLTGKLFIDQPRGFQGFSISDKSVSEYRSLRIGGEVTNAREAMHNTMYYR